MEVSPPTDGYLAGSGVGVERPSGDAGERLHRWIGFAGAAPTDADRAAADRMFANTGAVVIGRRMFDVGIGPPSEDGAFGRPVFVVPNRPEEVLVKGPTTVTFVTEGVARAVELARDTAGGQDVVVAGVAHVVRQCLAAGLVDEIRLHTVPVLLGGGARLFDGRLDGRIELERTDVALTPHATHQTFRVAPGTA